jgi:hypothetical protein
LQQKEEDMLADQATVKYTGLSVEGENLESYLKKWAAKEVDKQQQLDLHQKQELVGHQRNRVIKGRLRYEPLKQPNGAVKRFDNRERRCYAMLKEMKEQNLPPVQEKNYTKRMRVLDAMLHYEEKVKPALKKINAEIDLTRSMHAKAISKYLSDVVAPKFQVDPTSFKPSNISNMITYIVRAFRFIGIMNKQGLTQGNGVTYDYNWMVDLQRHGIGVEQLDWAFMETKRSEEFKELTRQGKRLKKSTTAVDDLDKDTKEVLKAVLDENESLKKQLQQLQEEKNNGDRAPEPAEADEPAPMAWPGTPMCLAHVEEPLPAPEPAVTRVQPRQEDEPQPTTSHRQDPLQVISGLKDHLTRGSVIEIKITV